MKAYYIIHDVSNSTMGFAGKFIDMGPPIATQNYTQLVTVGQDASDGWNSTVKWLAVGVAAFVSLVMIIGGTYIFIIKKDVVSPT